jgi:hypothetical protein
LPTEEYYQQKIAACTADVRRIQEKLNGMALLRLLTFAGICFFIYLLGKQYSSLLLVFLFCLAAAFILFLNIYFRWKDDRRLAEKLLFVNVNELGLLTGKPNQFPEGASFLNSDNYLDDLDIFGRGSLFHLINRTTTVKGRNALAGRLREPLQEPAAIVSQQTAVRVLAAQTHLRQWVTANGLLNEGKETDIDPGDIRDWLQTPPVLYNRVLRQAGIYLLIAFNLFGIYIWIDRNNYTLALLGAIISRIILAAVGRYVGKQHDQIDHKRELFDQYAGIFAAYNTIDAGDSVELAELRDRTKNAREGFRRLSSISNFLDFRKNGVVNVLLNTFLLFDLHGILRLERWKAAYRDSLAGWLEAIATIELLNSLATFAYNNPDFSYPLPVASASNTIATLAAGPGSPPAGDPVTGPHRPTPGEPAASGNALFIETTRVAHPLIPAARRIANDCSIGREEKLVLVTGSNMSGKTTFLRTLGVNVLMAQCGLPVCAATFVFTPMQLLTSLRIDDSLLEQTSYFMAELKKLQRIVHRLQTGAPALVLIDEILRGTNSEDKTYGSEHFIHRLLQYNCLSLFATHDLSLGSLEKPGTVSNYCFESVITNGELHFDYQLKRGVATNRNASFLMKKMDII